MYLVFFKTGTPPVDKNREKKRTAGVVQTDLLLIQVQDLWIINFSNPKTSLTSYYISH